MDSNHRMSESKSDALPTWRIPNCNNRMWCLRPGLEPTAHPQRAGLAKCGASNFMLLKTSLKLACVTGFEPVPEGCYAPRRGALTFRLNAHKWRKARESNSNPLLDQSAFEAVLVPD